ncbi:glycosyltransferase family 4 protein [Paraburkholderia hayleyella]|uniref:glycosyltransferase family 4 protein n=1 Tax=Paraburkholderia hayleyella TaxID=2152889 RepID=UPI0012922339|nr:glycosyltransferase family 4 protein [Paraburkholderia hayleyella]
MTSTSKPASRLRISLVCNTAWAIHTYRHGLIRTLLARGVEVTVLAPPDRAFEPLRAMGCHCIALPLAAQGTNPLADLRTLGALYRRYRALRPQLVFHYTIKPNIYGSIAAWLARVPSVAVTTGLGYAFIQSGRTARFARRLYRFAFRFPREIWFLNQDDQATFLAQKLLVHPERAQLLHGEGVDLEHFAFCPLPPSAPPAPFVFVLIGRLLWDKGVAEYVAAARQLRARYPHARFQLLGPTDVANPSAISRANVATWEHEGVIDYLGEADDVRPAITAASCVVLPSYREGVPRTLLEAAAIGRPIVATDVPGCRDVVEDGVNGFLCAARDANSLAAALTRILELDDAARQQMAERGRQKVSAEFDERDVIARYLALIERVSAISLQP